MQLICVCDETLGCEARSPSGRTKRGTFADGPLPSVVTLSCTVKGSPTSTSFGWSDALMLGSLCARSWAGKSTPSAIERITMNRFTCRRSRETCAPVDGFWRLAVEKSAPTPAYRASVRLDLRWGAAVEEAARRPASLGFSNCCRYRARDR